MSSQNAISRRGLLGSLGAAAGAASLVPAPMFAQAEQKGPTTSTVADRERRMKWWHEARFGMFVHFGLYSVLGRHEWVMERKAFLSPSTSSSPKSSTRNRMRPSLGRAGEASRNEVHGDDHQTS